MSVVHDLFNNSAGMDPVTDVVKANGSFTSAWAEILSGICEKPIIRCENCAKSPEEIGPNAKFMQCSGCKFERNRVSITVQSERLLSFARSFNTSIYLFC